MTGDLPTCKPRSPNQEFCSHDCEVDLGEAWRQEGRVANDLWSHFGRTRASLNCSCSSSEEFGANLSYLRRTFGRKRLRHDSAVLCAWRAVIDRLKFSLSLQNLMTQPAHRKPLCVAFCVSFALQEGSDAVG